MILKQIHKNVYCFSDLLFAMWVGKQHINIVYAYTECQKQ